MGNTYLEMTAKRKQGISDFPMFFAFSPDQFAKGMESIGLTAEDKDKVCVGFAGGIYRKTDHRVIMDTLIAFDKEHAEAIKNDKTGEGFIYDMFRYELSNHEYTYTMEVDQTLDFLGLSIEEVNGNKCLLHGLQKACADLRAEDEEAE